MQRAAQQRRAGCIHLLQMHVISLLSCACGLHSIRTTQRILIFSLQETVARKKPGDEEDTVKECFRVWTILSKVLPNHFQPVSQRAFWTFSASFCRWKAIYGAAQLQTGSRVDSLQMCLCKIAGTRWTRQVEEKKRLLNTCHLAESPLCNGAAFIVRLRQVRRSTSRSHKTCQRGGKNQHGKPKQQNTTSHLPLYLMKWCCESVLSAPWVRSRGFTLAQRERASAGEFAKSFWRLCTVTVPLLGNKCYESRCRSERASRAKNVSVFIAKWWEICSNTSSLWLLEGFYVADTRQVLVRAYLTISHGQFINAHWKRASFCWHPILGG